MITKTADDTLPKLTSPTMIFNDTVFRAARHACLMTVLVASAAAQIPVMPSALKFDPETPLPVAVPVPEEGVPLLRSPCEVCGSGMEVEFPENLIDLGVQFISCEKFETDGLAGLLPEAACGGTFAENHVKPQCGCILSGSEPRPSQAPAVPPSSSPSRTLPGILIVFITLAIVFF